MNLSQLLLSAMYNDKNISRRKCHGSQSIKSRLLNMYSKCAEKPPPIRAKQVLHLMNILFKFFQISKRSSEGVMQKHFQQWCLGFIFHAWSQNIHLWMMKTGSVVSRMDIINHLLLPLKPRGWGTGPVRTGRQQQMIWRVTMFNF